MSKEWVEEIEKLSDKELMKELDDRRDNMFFQDLWVSEMLIRVLKKLNKDTDVAKGVKNE